MKIPLAGVDVGPAEIELVNAVLRTPYLSRGPYIRQFEEAFARYLGVAHAVAVSSGTAGLHLAMIAAGVEAGDLVITTPFSFVASANCILYQGAIPVFVDVDPATGNIDPALVAQAAHDLTQGGPAAQRWLPPSIPNRQSTIGNLKSILPVHIFGQPCDMNALREVAARNGLCLVEDACEALGAEYRGQRVGTFGQASVFAFYPNKQMTTGEGGMLATDREEWAGLFRSLRNQGRDRSGTWLNHVRLGYNYRLPEMSAALGLAQLRRIDELLGKRDRVAARYAERLRTVDGVAVIEPAPGTTRLSWFVYVVRLDEGVDRDAVMGYLGDRGIPTRPYFVPIHLQPLYRERFGYREGMYPAAEAAGASTLALPFHHGLADEEIEYVCACLRAAIEATS